ncbi:hypothetical protein [Streptomyces sp. NBC_00091]|uniref:hypothetical protein n=1 Tax=Streptomyces sp. NBC_00091 TaxID=2975648 RepID=UPI002256058D|nr:hypothetical protein [Streptomyces sp. NBC_00091]MCX5375961.1 hypothetical protein [Streptomyces sp. NBC_00091]
MRHMTASRLLAFGASGGDTRAWLAHPVPAVRGAAALAPALARDPEAVRSLGLLVRSPRAFGDRRLYEALVAAACARAGDPDRLYEGALAALPYALRGAGVPCPLLGPYLRRFFPAGPVPGDAYARAFAHALAGEEPLWSGARRAAREATFAAAGLPGDREHWREAARAPSRPYTAADLLVLEGHQAVRLQVGRWFGAGREDPGLPDAVVGRLAGWLGPGARITVHGPLSFTAEAAGPPLPAEVPFETPYRPGFPWFRLSLVSALCSRVTVRNWDGARVWEQRWADGIALSARRDLGATRRTGYRAGFRLDGDWLPDGASLTAHGRPR